MTASSFSWPYPSLIAHRCGGKLAPENTPAAMRVGAAHGFAMFEYDVKLSKDDVLFLLHDDDLDRTSNGQGPAKDRTWAELSALDAGSWLSPTYAGERMATLDEVAAFTLQQAIASNVEIKPCPGREAETGTAVALAVQRLWQGAAVPPLLSSFSEDALAAAHVAAPLLPRALLVEKIPSDWRDRMVQHDCVALNVNQRDVTPELVRDVHAAGYRLCAWTVNDAQRARDLLAWGVDGLFTDMLDTIRPPFPAPAQSAQA
ncbi:MULTISPECIES: glycerophosphodiester phosphodiesterase [unclassified Achromobacter]|uniref:glycerophosphodiester phosphodiesterase n=1 Tax=unclassified Achromobacter TaxID=2626865 RepID=UPI000B519226|nr:MULTISPECIES: glycerophosphodiester phosphodiesterase [unclassified Achromobacter]OWT80606.1 glycerophosphodiester phosphodiesterase [Achromobacter sp. HZ34]OWT82489.1 glycerophosphodiester phosphodiesterase [Achromobacter sp. HZ28]